MRVASVTKEICPFKTAEVDSAARCGVVHRLDWRKIHLKLHVLHEIVTA